MGPALQASGERLVLHTTPLPEAGLALPAKGSFGQLFSLEGSGKTLPSVLTMFWVLCPGCGRQLPGWQGAGPVFPVSPMGPFWPHAL